MVSLPKLLLSSILDLNNDLIVIFKDEQVVMTNQSFNKFFNVGSTDEYNERFGDFVNNFVPHPKYFHKDKVADSESWIEAIDKLDESERVVSMLSQTYEPLAFSIDIYNPIDAYYVLVFEDITQDLIKRIMIQNSSNIDEQSGAYAKKYFMEIKQSYQEAAQYNEKKIALILIDIYEEEDVDHKKFVEDLNAKIRQDDMLVKWSEQGYLLIYMVDDIDNAKIVLSKFEKLIEKEQFSQYKCKLKFLFQDENQSLKSLISKV